MTTKIEIIQNFMAALGRSDIDGALAFFADDAVVDSPMGPQRGKSAIRSGLQMAASMPAPGGGPSLSQDGEDVLAKMSSPMGEITMRFSFAGDLISRETITMG